MTEIASSRTTLVHNPSAGHIEAPSEGGKSDETADPISSPTLQQNVPTWDQQRARHNGIRVHDSRLYTDLLDASDWAEFLRLERAAKKRAVLVQHSEEEEIERAHREELQRKVQQDAKVIAEARRRQEAAAKERADTAAFQSRNDAFLHEQKHLLDAWAPIRATHDAHRHRVRLRLYQTWEQQVFLPTQQEISAKVATKCGDAAPTEASRRAAAAQWGRRKDVLWRSFLEESNRKNRMGGPGGVFLDGLDEVEYNPLQQCQEETIRYKRRTLPASEVDRHRDEAQQLDHDYTSLALRYRVEERRSRTGALQADPAPQPGTETVDGILLPMESVGRSGFASMMSLSGPVSSVQHKEGCPPPQMPPPPAYAATTTLPRTYIPFNFGASAGTSSTRSPQRLTASGHFLLPSPTTTMGRRSGGLLGNSGSVCHTNQTNHHNTTKMPVMGDDATWRDSSSLRGAAGRAEVRTVLECQREVLPLPLNAVPEIPKYEHIQAQGRDCCSSVLQRLPWVDGAAAVQQQLARRAAPRSHYLPVTHWSRQSFRPTIYGHNTTEDGDMEPVPEERRAERAYYTQSRVHMNHHDFPQTAETPHFQKRMSVWRQV